MIIRQLTTSNAVALSQVYEEWLASTFEGLLNLPTTIGWGITNERIILGFILYQQVQEEAEILMMAVRAEYRHQGVGHQLLAQSIALLHNAGVCSIFLEVNIENAPAIYLYRKNGFKENGRRSGYYASPTGERHDALTMTLQHKD